MQQLLFLCFMDSFLFKHQVLFRVDFLSGTVPQGVARGQNQGHLKKKKHFFFVYFSLM